MRQLDDLERAFDGAVKARAGGLVILEDRFLFGLRRRITRLALRYRLPAVYAQTGYVDADGLAVYAPDIHEMIRRSTKTARALSLALSPTIVQRADRVID